MKYNIVLTLVVLLSDQSQQMVNYNKHTQHVMFCSCDNHQQSVPQSAEKNSLQTTQKISKIHKSRDNFSQHHAGHQSLEQITTNRTNSDHEVVNFNNIRSHSEITTGINALDVTNLVKPVSTQFPNL